MLSLLALIAFASYVVRIAGVLVVAIMFFILKKDFNNWPLISTAALMVGAMFGAVVNWPLLSVGCAVAYLYPLYKAQAQALADQVRNDLEGRK